MDDCLVKPLPLARLKSVLEQYLPRDALSEARAWREAAGLAVRTAPSADLTVLRELIGDDPVAIDEVLCAFRVSARHTLEEFDHSALTGSKQAATDAAHRLKAAARTIGAFQLADQCAAIEASVESIGTQALGLLLDAFRLELEAVNRCLNDFSAEST